MVSDRPMLLQDTFFRQWILGLGTEHFFAGVADRNTHKEFRGAVFVAWFSIVLPVELLCLLFLPQGVCKVDTDSESSMLVLSSAGHEAILRDLASRRAGEVHQSTVGSLNPPTVWSHILMAGAMYTANGPEMMLVLYLCQYRNICTVYVYTLQCTFIHITAQI